jgi:hypothetical protein
MRNGLASNSSFAVTLSNFALILRLKNNYPNNGGAFTNIPLNKSKQRQITTSTAVVVANLRGRDSRKGMNSREPLPICSVAWITDTAMLIGAQVEDTTKVH